MKGTRNGRREERKMDGEIRNTEKQEKFIESWKFAENRVWIEGIVIRRSAITESEDTVQYPIVNIYCEVQ